MPGFRSQTIQGVERFGPAEQEQRRAVHAGAAQGGRADAGPDTGQGEGCGLGRFSLDDDAQVRAVTGGKDHDVAAARLAADLAGADVGIRQAPGQQHLAQGIGPAGVSLFGIAVDVAQFLGGRVFVQDLMKIDSGLAGGADHTQIIPAFRPPAAMTSLAGQAADQNCGDGRGPRAAVRHAVQDVQDFVA